jgi:ABC-type transporter Mla subunit MlaD
MPSSENNINYDAIINALKPFEIGDWDALTTLSASFFAVLLLGFLMLLWTRVRPLRSRSNEIKKLTDGLLDDYPYPSLPITDTDIWRDHIWLRLRTISWLAPATLELQEQCWLDKEKQKRNAHQCGEYLTANIFDPGLQRFGATIPGLLTALGILGTFVGITIGLTSMKAIGADVDPNLITDSMMTDVKGLVKALGVSFRTSIWGLIFSMLSTAFLSHSESNLRSERQRLVGWLDASLKRGTEHDLLQDQCELLRNISGHSEGTEGEIQSLAEQISEKFENVILGTVNASGKREGGLAGEIKEVQSQGVGSMLDEFMEKMGQSFGTQFQGLGASIGSMVAANESYQDTMGTLISGLSTASASQADVTTKMAEAVDGATQAVTHIQSTVATLGTSADNINTAAETVGGTLRQQLDLAEQQRLTAAELLNALSAQKDGWQTHQEAITGTYNSMEGRFDELSNALVALTTWHNQVKDELSQQINAWNEALTTQQGITSDMADERSHITDFLTKFQTIAASFEGLHRGLEQLSDTLTNNAERTQTTVENQTAITTAQQGLSEELLAALQAQSTGWGEHQESMIGAYRNIEGEFGDLRGALEGLTVWHNSVKEELSAQITSWQDALTVQQGLTSSIQDERTNVDSMLSRLAEVTQSLASLQSGLTALAEKLTSTSADFGQAGNTGARAIEDAGRTFTGIGQEVREQITDLVRVVSALGASLPDITNLLAAVTSSVSAQQQIVTNAKEVSSEFMQTADSQNAIRLSFEQVATASEATRLALEPVANSLTSGALALNAATEGLEGIVDGTGDIADSISDAATKLTTAEATAQQRWQTVNSSLRDTTGALNEGMTQYSNQVNTNLTDVLKQFDGQLRGALGALEGAVHGLSSVLNDLTDYHNDRMEEGE